MTSSSYEWVRLAAHLFVMLLLGANCAPEPRQLSDDARGIDVLIEGIAFDPDALTISVGRRVTWENRDPVRHTVTSGDPGEQGVPGVSKGRPGEPDGLFAADLRKQSESFSFVFDESGKYVYYCEIHPSMIGVIHVT